MWIPAFAFLWEFLAASCPGTDVSPELLHSPTCPGPRLNLLQDSATVRPANTSGSFTSLLGRVSIGHDSIPCLEFCTCLLGDSTLAPPLSPLPWCPLTLSTHHSLSRPVAPSWCLDTWEGQDTSSSPTASGTVPRASDLLAAAGSPEIPSLSLRTSYLLHTVPVPTHRWPKFPIISSITGSVGHVLYSYNCGSDVNRLFKKRQNQRRLKVWQSHQTDFSKQSSIYTTKADCLLNFFHRYFQHPHGSKTENIHRDIISENTPNSTCLHSTCPVSSPTPHHR